MQTVSDEIFITHREELRRTLTATCQDVRIPPRRAKLFPPFLATYLWHELHPSRHVPPVARFSDTPNQAIRKFHNYYGWRAEHRQRGRCAGALYRTARFMELPFEARDGSKGPHRNIHIEHSVPAAVLKAALECRISDFTTSGNLHDFLIRHSVCCAFHYREEKNMGKCGVPQRTSSTFNGSGEKKGDYPFLRYKRLLDADPDFEIFNVVTGEPINIETFTFEDHFETLQAAYDLVAEGRDDRAMVYSSAFFAAEAWEHYARPLNPGRDSSEVYSAPIG